MAKTMLIVDDEPPVAAFLSRSGRRFGFDVVVTTTAELFRDAYPNRPHDVIVLDLQMPGNDGVELMRFLAEQHCRATIVVASGLERRVVETTVRLGNQLGLTMGPILLKPFRGAAVSALFDALGRPVAGASGQGPAAAQLASARA